MPADAVRRTGTVARQVTGAVMLGLGTLLVMKADPREHWATPPAVHVVAVAEDAGDPDEPVDPLAFEPYDPRPVFPEPAELLTAS